MSMDRPISTPEPATIMDHGWFTRRQRRFFFSFRFFSSEIPGICTLRLIAANGSILSAALFSRHLKIFETLGRTRLEFAKCSRVSHLESMWMESFMPTDYLLSYVDNLNKLSFTAA